MTHMLFRWTLIGCSTVALSCWNGANLPAADPAPTEATPTNRETLEADFAKLLTGANLVGTFSIVGKEANKPERYEISSAEKLEGDNWVITARIKYGDKDVKVPIVVKVYWADDTPVISLTKLAIPGLGTFTSRVMFYGDRYAGTWQHDGVGGHMWGLVEPKQATEAKPQ
jgi:hypothetical protein